jgi:thiol-disulfide isomerase/thioredoxin
MSRTRSLLLCLAAGMAFSTVAQAQEATTPTDPVTAPVVSEPAGPTLKVGVAAPALKVAKWVKGSEVKSFEEGKVYVVEFWATWCGPCKRTIPELTKFANEMKDKVTVIGVSVWENPPGETGTEYIGKVEKFVEGMGDKMNYNVCADTVEGDMAKTWMEASAQGGIPTAFVVGKDGKIAWIGHPMDGLEKVAAAVYEGTFDPAKAEKDREDAEKAQAARQESMMKIMGMHQEGKTAEAIAELDKIAATETADDVKLELGVTKFMLLTSSDEAAANQLAKELSTGAAKDNPQMLYAMSSMMLEGEMKSADYALCVDMVSRACELHRAESEDKKDHPALLALLAKAQFKKGDAAAAVATQENALKLIDEMGPGVPEEAKAEFKAALDEYKAGVK